MDAENVSSWLPDIVITDEGKERRVGIEVEFAGIDPIIAATCVRDQFGGSVESSNIFEVRVVDTTLGDFLVELDTNYLKPIGERLSQFTGADVLESMASELITRAAEQFVPWELVSPPIPLSNLENFQHLLDHFKDEGALGTRHAIHYAFGLHLNPELPNLKPETILNYLRAYFCLYDWIVEQERIDFARKLTPYINHFDKSYIQKILDSSYKPDQPKLIDDYLEANPTRNRSMDLLPLFSFLDEDRVRQAIDDKRIKSRPTLHYRLPNCDIDNASWSLLNPWGEWLKVEKLANNPKLLSNICTQYQQYLSSFTNPFSNQWLQQTQQWLSELDN